MNIGRKIQIAKTAISSITRHDDEDSTLLKAAIAELVSFLGTEEEGIEARNTAAILAQLSDEG